MEPKQFQQRLLAIAPKAVQAGQTNSAVSAFSAMQPFLQQLQTDLIQESHDKAATLGDLAGKDSVAVNRDGSVTRSPLDPSLGSVAAKHAIAAQRAAAKQSAKIVLSNEYESMIKAIQADPSQDPAQLYSQFEAFSANLVGNIGDDVSRDVQNSANALLRAGQSTIGGIEIERSIKLAQTAFNAQEINVRSIVMAQASRGNLNNTEQGIAAAHEYLELVNDIPSLPGMSAEAAESAITESMQFFAIQATISEFASDTDGLDTVSKLRRVAEFTANPPAHLSEKDVAQATAQIESEIRTQQNAISTELTLKSRQADIQKARVTEAIGKIDADPNQVLSGSIVENLLREHGVSPSDPNLADYVANLRVKASNGNADKITGAADGHLATLGADLDAMNRLMKSDGASASAKNPNIMRTNPQKILANANEIAKRFPLDKQGEARKYIANVRLKLNEFEDNRRTMAKAMSANEYFIMNEGPALAGENPRAHYVLQGDLFSREFGSKDPRTKAARQIVQAIDSFKATKGYDPHDAAQGRNQKALGNTVKGKEQVAASWQELVDKNGKPDWGSRKDVAKWAPMLAKFEFVPPELSAILSHPFDTPEKALAARDLLEFAEQQKDGVLLSILEVNGLRKEYVRGAASLTDQAALWQFNRQTDKAVDPTAYRTRAEELFSRTPGEDGEADGDSPAFVAIRESLEDSANNTNLFSKFLATLLPDEANYDFWSFNGFAKAAFGQLDSDGLADNFGGLFDRPEIKIKDGLVKGRLRAAVKVAYLSLENSPGSESEKLKLAAKMGISSLAKDGRYGATLYGYSNNAEPQGVLSDIVDAVDAVAPDALMLKISGRRRLGDEPVVVLHPIEKSIADIPLVDTESVIRTAIADQFDKNPDLINKAMGDKFSWTEKMFSVAENAFLDFFDANQTALDKIMRKKGGVQLEFAAMGANKRPTYFAHIQLPNGRPFKFYLPLSDELLSKVKKNNHVGQDDD